MTPPNSERASAAPGGPVRKASLAVVSASRAVRPIAVAWMIPVQAGAGRGIEQMVGEAAVGAPEAGLYPARRDRPALELELVGELVHQRMLDPYLPRLGPLAPDPKVSSRVDDVCRIPAEPRGGDVRCETLAGAAEIDSYTRGPADPAGLAIDRDPPPGLVRSRSRRAAGRGRGKREIDRSGYLGRLRRRVADTLELVGEDRIDEALERSAAQRAASTAAIVVELTVRLAARSAFSAESSLSGSNLVRRRCMTRSRPSICIAIASGEGSPSRTGSPIKSRT